MDQPKQHHEDENKPVSSSRRTFLKQSSAVVVLTATPPLVARSATDEKTLANLFEKMPLSIVINGQSQQLSVEPRTTLLDLLREQLKLTGTKKGCDYGQCGACTVHVEGERVLSCLTLAVMLEGKKVTTIEGLSIDGRLHPMQEAFIHHDGLQCGYCTPGQIMSGIACIAEGHATSPETVKEFMSGNICRCGAYPNITAAILEVQQTSAKSYRPKKKASTVIGDPADRVEAKAKVTGEAKYAAEYKLADLTYGVLVSSTIAKGRITAIDTQKATSVPGVVTILTHLNRPDVPGWKQQGASGGESRVEGQEFRVFYDDKIYFDRQPVALVIAETLEKAREAAAQVKVSYEKAKPATSLKANQAKGKKPKRAEDYKRGEPDIIQQAAVKVEASYTTSIQVHNPMEMHAATVSWSKATNTISDYNKTQAVKIALKDIIKTFAVKEEQVSVHSPYVGGAFGSSSRIWPPEMAALMGAQQTGRPVVVMASRQQVFNLVGYRPASQQKITIGATTEGIITAIHHHVTGGTSTYEEFTERLTDPTRSCYAAPNMSTSYKLVPLDMSTPCWTRGPGETSGSFALESAMDELAYALHTDPIALRLKNFADKDPANGLPWSSNYLKECYERGAKQFGWNKRNPLPRSMKQDDWLLGMGMATGIYKSDRSPASASATLRQDGSLLVQSSVADVGPGSATVMTQIAADTFGIDMDKVEFQWGQSALPEAPGQFGSHTTASVGTAVYEAMNALQQRLKEIAINKSGTPFEGSNIETLYFEKGMLRKRNSTASAQPVEALQWQGVPELKVTIRSSVSHEKERFSGKSFCAHFVEVLVHPATGAIKVSRVVSAIDAGKVMNHKTATSQVYGSVVWGIGIALMEEGVLDHRYGRYMNNNLADYHLPVNADIPPIEVLFIDKPDPVIDPMGAKGLGEIGLIGFTAAIANAVYHATGKRIRDLPITADKLL